jgi:hypothetical protein
MGEKFKILNKDKKRILKNVLEKNKVLIAQHNIYLIYNFDIDAQNILGQLVNYFETSISPTTYSNAKKKDEYTHTVVAAMLVMAFLDCKYKDSAKNKLKTKDGTYTYLGITADNIKEIIKCFNPEDLKNNQEGFKQLVNKLTEISDAPFKDLVLNDDWELKLKSDISESSLSDQVTSTLVKESNNDVKNSTTKKWILIKVLVILVISTAVYLINKNKQDNNLETIVLESLNMSAKAFESADFSKAIRFAEIAHLIKPTNQEARTLIFKSYHNFKKAYTGKSNFFINQIANSSSSSVLSNVSDSPILIIPDQSYKHSNESYHNPLVKVKVLGVESPTGDSTSSFSVYNWQKRRLMFSIEKDSLLCDIELGNERIVAIWGIYNDLEIEAKEMIEYDFSGNVISNKTIPSNIKHIDIDKSGTYISQLVTDSLMTHVEIRDIYGNFLYNHYNLPVDAHKCQFLEDSNDKVVVSNHYEQWLIDMESNEVLTKLKVSEKIISFEHDKLLTLEPIYLTGFIPIINDGFQHLSGYNNGFGLWKVYDLKLGKEKFSVLNSHCRVTNGMWAFAPQSASNNFVYNPRFGKSLNLRTVLTSSAINGNDESYILSNEDFFITCSSKIEGNSNSESSDSILLSKYNWQGKLIDRISFEKVMINSI